MAFFTVVLEFSGGTYISQFKAASAHAAAVKHAAHLISIKGMSTSSDRKRLSDRLSQEQPIRIQGIRNVWCCSASVGRKFALVNIVATAEGGF
jgi:3-deoxy-D-manno-octulosonic-acid transferase